MKNTNIYIYYIYVKYKHSTPPHQSIWYLCPLNYETDFHGRKCCLTRSDYFLIINTLLSFRHMNYKQIHIHNHLQTHERGWDRSAIWGHGWDDYTWILYEQLNYKHIHIHIRVPRYERIQDGSAIWKLGGSATWTPGAEIRVKLFLCRVQPPAA